MYPIFLDVAERNVLIVGGGAVAARKARGLLDAGATRLRAVATAFCENFPPAVACESRRFEPADLDGVDLCFAATDDPSVNAGIVQLCRERRILVNRADRDVDIPSDFATPAIHRDGPIAIAVSASGSPAIAVAVRNAIRAQLDPGWADFARAALAMRESILGLPGLDQPQREAILRTLASEEGIAAFRAGRREGLWHMLRKRHPVLPVALTPMQEAL